MIRAFTIKNYKSILDDTIALGRINVFIGENGCGKTNILEAMAMAGAALTDKLDGEELYARGIRVARPSITFSSFLGAKQRGTIDFDIAFDTTKHGGEEQATFRLESHGEDSISSQWIDTSTTPSVALRPTNEEVFEKAAKQLSRLEGKPSQEQTERLLLDTLFTSLGPRQFEKVVRMGLQVMSRQRLSKDLGDFVIYNANPLALRGLMTASRREPLGIYGENLDVVIASLGEKGLKELLQRSQLIPWIARILVDPDDKLKFEGYKLGRSTSTLYFRDRFMRQRNNVFSAENANEGILHVLFYLTLFISQRTPKIFAIDNIDTALNPQLCRELMKQLAELARAHDKQALITTHDPAILDGMNLHEDDQRLFVVSRSDAGHTVTKRIKLKPEAKGKEPKLKLSELWMRGYLGGLPQRF